MRKTLPLFVLALTAFGALSTPAMAQDESLNPDRTSDEKAVYSATEHTVTLSAKAPETTVIDWSTYTYHDLTHIDSITIHRRFTNTYDDGVQVGTVATPAVGATFSYVDRQVQDDQNYEYYFTVYVDGLNSGKGYVSVYTGVLPGNITAFDASAPSFDKAEVDITVTAPTAMKDGSPLADNVSIDIQTGSIWDGYQTLHTFENVEAGKTYTWRHTGMQMEQTITYRAYARSGQNGKGITETVDTHVGLVAPGTPANFVARRQGDSVVLTWEKPAKGAYNGDYDAANTLYKLTRVYLDKSEQLVATNISGYTYTDSPNVDEETAVTYQLVALNTVGESAQAAVSQQVTVGKPLDLPFEESFTRSQYDHKGWTTLSTQDDPYYTYNAWNLYSSESVYYLPEDTYLAVAPVDNDGGMATCLFYGYCPDGQSEALVSPHINVNGAENVELKFCYWEMAQDATKNELKVWVSRDDAEWQLLWTSDKKEEMEPQWSRVTLPIRSTSACNTLRVKIEAVRHEGPVTDVLLDNITLTELSHTGIDGVRPGQAEPDAEQYFTLSGMRIAKPAARGTYLVKKNGVVKKVAVR